MLAQIKINQPHPNARLEQVYKAEQAVAVIYDSEPDVEFVFIPYQKSEDQVGVFPFYKGKHIPFKADLKKFGDDDIQVITDAGIATYNKEGRYLKDVDFVKHANVKTDDEIAEMYRQRMADSGVDEMIGYYQQCNVWRMS